MPSIPGATGRGLRVLPRLGVGEALGILATAVVDVAVLRTPWAWGARVVTVALASGAGLIASVVLWPPGPDGEPVRRWLKRLGGYLLHPRWRAGATVRAWLGHTDIVGPYLVHRGGCAAVLECAGPDPALGGEGAWTAATAGYRELLHALDQPLKVVLVSRWLREADRPACYRADRVPSGMERVAAAYAAHWSGLVAERCWVVRSLLLVPSAAGWNGEARANLEATVACVQRLAARLGLECRRLAGDELVHRWREWAGDACPGPKPDGHPGWRVRGWSDA